MRMRDLHNSVPTKKIIAVDFDGTLVFNNYPTISNPNLDLVYFIKDNRDKYTWILWTCRQGTALKNAIDYMRLKFGIEFDYVNANTIEKIDEFGDTRKVYADYYIDDKNCHLNTFIKEIQRDI